ncbi:restriction endonuclease subunit S [Arthrobacter sp. UCD-GKA]|uniref:restriction endonuclease subunit S n=1 Tax=Arthrobacter sp. UCD-GKA TaxID=1913576 RepID=UPI0009F3E9C5|nr:restriction endonuclease subunit S [Arthrobacter sp. UCD-GKA]
MRGNIIDLNEARRINDATFAEWTARLAPKSGDLLFAREAPVGPVVEIPEGVSIAPGQRTMLLRADPSKANNRFLRYYLISPLVQARLHALAHGSTVPHLRLPIIRNFEVVLPELKEQQAIAEVLGALDDKITANTKIAHTIEALGSAKFTRVGLDVEPSNEVVLLGDVFDLNPRRTVVSASPTVIDMQALPTTAPLVERWNTGLRKGGARFANGDTLIARITPCLENRKTAFVDFLNEGDVGIGSTEFIVMRSKKDLPLGLSYFMAVSERFRDFAIQNLVGTSGRQRVSAADLARHTLSPVDPFTLRTFGEWADVNLNVLGSLRGENRTLAATRDALLPQLMSGRLRVKEAEAVVAAAI